MVSALVIYVVCIASPLIGFAEPLVIIIGAAGKLNPLVAAVAVAAGQCTCWGGIYLCGERLVACLPTLRRKVDALQLSEEGSRKTVATCLSGLVGLPPATALAAAGQLFDPYPSRLLLLLFLGRLVRFLAMGMLPSIFSSLFSVEAVPSWVSELL